ncbi:UbiH/UbiF/VisC/COQ6 family ubiquinone biosynthesis hydroxylase [Sneathiella sp.]|uniref:UbiH/UbiF/VisC/COQ6 family ubiquinone biosynthesis hydroxylase n=1 Tax=Sneathiella sp. TaxID=1964365 RepID=UPI0026150393|nr:UbiH/UbiF/VisC/COQ6 family ubiquinone biosynthesis hydroxylase [Sneathiella sp.]MDF2368914.1 UbiH/UbiF/VisC/COQ6 family ubiquinone biosynthesis hydroxylase [Sneathiella sp.]
MGDKQSGEFIRMAEMMTEKSINVDVLVVGGGLNGLPFAIAVASAGLDVLVLEKEEPTHLVDTEFDGRVSAIAHASRNLLRSCDVWKHVKAKEPMLDIRITDGPSKFFLHYDHSQLGDEPFGHMVENRHLREALYARAAEISTLTIKAPTEYTDITRENSGVTARLASGETVTTRLVVAADGRNSPIRQQAGIKTVGWSYDQMGIVCTIVHEKPHHGVAQERFLKPGPFAILPMTGNRSSLVWTEPTERAKVIMALPDADFHREMATRFGDYLGDLKVAGPRWSYPLTLHQAERYADLRLALIGDAAHGMHPIAGQGLNLGLRDVAALAEVVIDAARLGQDIGGATVLEDYQRWRRFDSIVLLAITDGLNRLFTNDIPPVRLARDLGLAAVNKMPKLKGFFMEHARGTVGKMPRLLRGEAL